MWRHPAGFDALLAPGEERIGTRVGAETYRPAIAAARRTCDVVVLHAPRALDDVVRAGLELADRVLVVLGLDVLSFRDAKRAIEIAGLDGRCEFVVNRPGRSEVTARDVERVFGRALPVSSTKPLVGHTLGAAGAIEAAFCWLALANSEPGALALPPHWWDGEQDPELPALHFARKGETAAPRSAPRVMSNSFGFGGNNCTLVLGLGA